MTTKCFKEHACDGKELHKNTQQISDCESYFTEKIGRKFKITDVPILTCEGIWRAYQKEAEDIVAPGGVLIADPRARNRAINAAYAKLWLHDQRFQWAGLAAFASKQVGCGLLHAADSIKKIQAEYEAAKRLQESVKPRQGGPDLRPGGAVDKARRDYAQANRDNPVPTVDMRREGDPSSWMQDRFQHVHDVLALGNTTLFLDVYPLHAFYKKRGLKEMKTCLSARAKIYGNDRFPVLWPAGKNLEFGRDHPEILQAFEAIDAGRTAESVGILAQHEQVNILQPTIYKDAEFVRLVRINQLAYVTAFPSGVAEAIELTLASQCRRVDDGRTIGFGNDPIANLSNVEERMRFVLKAAARFDEMLRNKNLPLIQRSLQDIAAGQGVR